MKLLFSPVITRISLILILINILLLFRFIFIWLPCRPFDDCFFWLCFLDHCCCVCRICACSILPQWFAFGEAIRTFNSSSFVRRLSFYVGSILLFHQNEVKLISLLFINFIWTFHFIWRQCFYWFELDFIRWRWLSLRSTISLHFLWCSFFFLIRLLYLSRCFITLYLYQCVLLCRWLYLILAAIKFRYTLLLWFLYFHCRIFFRSWRLNKLLGLWKSTIDLLFC